MSTKTETTVKNTNEWGLGDYDPGIKTVEEYDEGEGEDVTVRHFEKAPVDVEGGMTAAFLFGTDSDAMHVIRGIRPLATPRPNCAYDYNLYDCGALEWFDISEEASDLDVATKSRIRSMNKRDCVVSRNSESVFTGRLATDKNGLGPVNMNDIEAVHALSKRLADEFNTVLIGALVVTPGDWKIQPNNDVETYEFDFYGTGEFLECIEFI